MSENISLENIRKELKSWENSFKEIYGRKPVKSDVDAAPARVRGLYRDYGRSRKGQPLDEPGKFARIGPKCCLNRNAIDFSKPIRPMIKISDHPKSKPTSSISSSTTSTTTDLISTDVIYPLGGINPVFSNDSPTEIDDPIGGRQFIAYYHAPSPYEMAVKRKNFSNLALVDIESGELRRENKDPPTDLDGSNSGSIPNEDMDEDQESENRPDADCSQESKPLVKKKRSASKKTNSNFVALNMKHNRYKCKGLKKLKGAALKRFLFRQRMRKHRLS